MARIVIEGVTKVFRGGVVAVNNVTIEVATASSSSSSAPRGAARRRCFGSWQGSRR